MEVKMSEYIKHILGIEKIKKEADALMLNKISKYEKKIADLEKELQEVKDDNKKLALQINEMINRLRDAEF
jgi:septal ring factor EnvC (AmiA/AmiB activator)